LGTVLFYMTCISETYAEHLYQILQLMHIVRYRSKILNKRHRYASHKCLLTSLHISIRASSCAWETIYDTASLSPPSGSSRRWVESVLIILNLIVALYSD
jgi:hypothetical protein